jgi:DNA modification methylase
MKSSDQGENLRVFISDATDMRELADESVNLIITSPPYWSLKDYGTDDQIGLGSGSFDKDLYQHHAILVDRQSSQIPAS